MRFIRLHSDPDMVITSPAYFKHYGDKLKEEYPDHEIVVDTMVDAGWSYLANKAELLKQSESLKPKLELLEN